MSSRVEDLEPVTLAMCREFLADCEARMFPPLRVTHTLRSMAEQLHLYAKGRKQTDDGWVVVDKKAIVTWAKPGQSPHNDIIDGKSCAFDICFLGKTPYPDDEQLWEAVGITGEMCGLTWGGRFTKLVDRCHFERKDWRELRDKSA